MHFIKPVILRVKVKKALLLFDESPKVFFVLMFAKKTWSVLKRLLYTIEQWLCVTVFKWTGRKTYSRIKSSVPWIVILSTDDAFLKISWRTDCIDHEIKNMQLLSKFESLRFLITPHVLKKHLCYSIIETQRRYLVADDAELFEAAEIILERFQRCAEIKNNHKMDDFEHVVNGLNVIEDICGRKIKQICANQIITLLDKESFYVGPAHGDFHHKNILKDLNGNYYIIDLDCFRLHGIQALDAIYFINEYFANINGLNWYEQLVMFAENKQNYSPAELSFLEKFCKISCKKWLLAYFLDRIGQDRSYVSTVSEMPVREIINFIDTYINKYNQDHQ